MKALTQPNCPYTKFIYNEYLCFSDAIVGGQEVVAVVESI